MRPTLYIVGVFADGEMVTFGPFSKETAEDMFKKLQAKGAPQPFIQPLQSKRALDRYKQGWT